jgi:hypothetical protein
MDKKFVCFLDILGFKDIVNKNSHEDVVNLFNKFKSILIFSLPDSMNELEENFVQPDYENIKTNSIVLSDSILIWTKDDSINSFYDLLQKVSRVLKGAFYEGFPLRGSIAHESFSFEKTNLPTNSHNEYQMLVGKALVRAYESEKIFEWSGCVIDESCKQALESEVANNQKNCIQSLSTFLTEEKILIEYQAPKKSGSIEKIFTVNWVDTVVISIKNKNEIESKFECYNKTINDWDVNRKIENTKAYIDFIIKTQSQRFIGTKVSVKNNAKS